MDNSDSEYEIEETVVLVELNGIIDADLLLQPQTLTKVLGIDTDEPLLQIGNCLFKGEYEDTLGTVVLYEPVDGSQKDGLENNGLKFLCKTDTKLTMKRCFPQERSMDNLKSTEVSPPVAIQSDEPKKSVCISKTKTPIKKKIVSKKKKITKLMPKKLVNSKKNTKNDQTNFVEQQNKEIQSKSETSEQLIENMAESIEDNSLSRSDAISSEVLNLQKGEEKSDQSKSAYFESLELQSNNKKTEVPKKRRKRNRDDAVSPDENIEDFAAKKLLKMEEAKAHVADKEIITFNKENKELDNSDSQKNNAIMSGTEVIVSETNRRDEQMADEECVIEALVSTVIDNECKMQEKGTFASETNKEKIMTDKSIAKTSENIVTNDASETPASDMEGKEKPLIEESVPTVLVCTVINNKSEIQEKSTVANISEMDKEPVVEEERIIEPVVEEERIIEPVVEEERIIEPVVEEERIIEPVVEEERIIEPVVEEERIVEPVDNTVGTKDSLEMGIVDPVIKAGIKKTMESIVASETNKGKLMTEKSIAKTSENIVTNDASDTLASDMDGKEKSLIEESVPTVLVSTVINNESEIQEKSTVANISEMDKEPMVEEERIIEPVVEEERIIEPVVEEERSIELVVEERIIEPVVEERITELVVEEERIVDRVVEEERIVDRVVEEERIVDRVVEEERIVEPEDNTVGTKDSSEMGIVDPVTEAGIKKTMESIVASETNKEKIMTEESITKTSENIVTNDASETPASDMDGKEKPLIEESVPTVLVSTVINTESEIQEKSTVANISEMDKELMVEEERIIEPMIEEEIIIEPVVEEERIIEPVDEEEIIIEPVVEEERIIEPVVEEEIIIEPVVKEEIIIEPVVKEEKRIEPEVEEEIIIEPVDDTLETNDSSEMDIVDLVIEAGIKKTMENIVVNIEGEIQQKRTPVSVLEVDENEEFVVEEESVAEALDNTINNVENLIHKGNTHLNIFDGDASGSLAGKTDGVDLVLKPGVVNDNDNCSSSCDTEHTRNEVTSNQAGACESSDDAVILHPGTESLEKIDDNNASSSCEENNESMLLEQILVTRSNVDETELTIASDNSEEKDAIYSVSKVANVDNGATRKLVEIEDHSTSGNSADELVLNTIDNLNPVSASDLSTPSFIDENLASGSRKHSSCEVTQSTNYEGEHLENKDMVSELEVFSQVQQNDNLEKNITIEVDDQFQSTESSLKLNSSASEISQSCQELKFSEGNLPVVFEADGAICSQSTDQPVVLLEVSTEGRDLCVSSCGIDDEAEDKENIEKEVYFNSEEDPDISNYEESETNVICEVSQSDESEKNIAVLSESSENEAKTLSSECDESFSNTEENLNVITDQHICEITGSIQEAANVPSTSSIQETANVPSTSSIQEAANVLSTSSIQKTANVPSTSSIQETANVPSTSSIQETANVPSTSSIQETANVPSTSSIQETANVPSTSSIQETANVPSTSSIQETKANTLSSEYDESFSNTEENLNNAITNQHVCEITGSIQEAANVPSTSSIQETANVPSTSSIHEVTQSCSIKDLKLSDLPSEKNISSECNKNEVSHAPTELYDDKLKDDCVSSVDVSAVSETLVEIEVDSEEKDLNSEVTQSFRPAENQQSDETSEASHSKAVEEIRIEETATEFKHPSEVIQCVELESSTSLHNQQNINECDRIEPSSDSLNSFSNYSVEYQGEICESSDDASNIGSNSHLEEVQPINYSMCEVSQSFRSEETVSTARHSTDSEMESSNECEVYPTALEPEAETNKLNTSEKNICESSDDVNEFESEVVIDQVSEREKSICESSDDVNEFESEIVIDQLSEREKIICESSDDINETESEIIIDQISNTAKNICESSDDINETESEIITDQLSDAGKNICESSDDINETESEIIIDQLSDAGKNICESSDDIYETESEIIIVQPSEREKNICESSDDINETESEMVINQLSEGEKNICESSDDISKNFGSIQQHTPIHLEGDISDEACQSSKFDENVLSASETQVEEKFVKYETSFERSNAGHSTICESSEDTIRIGLNDPEPNSGACTSSDKSVMESSDEAANLHGSMSSGSDVTVGDIENNQISQSSNVACGFIYMSEDGTENNMISQSGNSVNIPIYRTLNESENSQISQSGGYLEGVLVTEIESEISQSGGVTVALDVVTLNETENNQISQSGCVINAVSNVAVEETENDQISQSESTVGHLNDVFVTEAGNNQISQSGNNESASSEKALNEVENSQISQSGTVASYSANISITETENSLISQSGSVPVYSSDVSVTENENSQISQSGNDKEFLYNASVNESYNNQISQSSSSSNLPRSREMGNNQISQSGNSTDTVSGTENNQISQSSSGGCTLIKESENYQISQSSNSCGAPNILSSNETENNLISQSECNDNIYQLSQPLPSDSPFQAEVVNISSSSDIVTSNYIDVTNSSFHVSNSTISSNSEVSASLGSVRPHIWDRNSLVTSVTTSEMRTSVLSPVQTNEIESQSAQTSAHLAVSSCSVMIGENVTSMNQEMSSSDNINEVVESSLSLIREEDEVNKFIPKDDSPMSVSESVIEEMPSTSQNLDRTDEDRIQNTETSSSKTKLSREDFQPSVSGNSLLQRQFEFDPNLLQTSFLPCVSSQSDIGNNSSSTRPSFLEVMASSASDFRNSLLSENSFSKDKSHTSSAPESSGSNISSCGEFSESFIREADGLVRNRSSDTVSHAPENLSAVTDNSDPAYSEVSRSSGVKRKYSDSGEFGYSHHQVSQSSDVVNTLSSTSRTHALISDNISQSSQQDCVQSSSNILRTSVLVSNDSVSLIDQVSSADENTSFINKVSENADISESSIGVEAALPSCSQNTFSLSKSNQLIESSSDQPTITEDASDFKPENTESEVSSTPSETQFADFKVLTEAQDRFAAIEGNVIILPGTSNVIDESAVDMTTVCQVVSPDSDYAPVNSESVLILDSSNEAETLNCSSVSSPIAVQLPSFDQAALSVAAASQIRIASGSSISDVEAVNYEESSEVSESLMNNQNDISQSSLGDNNVSCSVSEFSTSAINRNYSFPDISQEAESKSSDDCISSYHSTCDNILPVPNLQSSADREFYSHVGEFDDSVQSSLDETHLAINEQIKAISSPQNSSDSASCEEPRSLSLNPFVTFSSQSHVFSTNYGATSSKITLCSNSASEIVLDRDNLIDDSPQVITTTSNSDIIISSFDPELTNMSQSPQNSANICSPEQYVELSEQIVPAVQIPGADFVESSNDQLDDSQSVENSVSQNDVLNTDSES